MYAEPLVECHSGFTYAESPRALHWEGIRRSVKRIAARWQQPGAFCFRVVTEDNLCFDVSYLELNDSWSISPV